MSAVPSWFNLSFLLCFYGFLNYCQFVCHRVSYFVFLCVLFGCYLVVSTNAVDWLERLVSEMTCYVLSGMLNFTHSLTHPSSNTVIFTLFGRGLTAKC